MGRLKRLVVGLVTLIAVVATAGPAMAGGWAVTTLDSAPAAVAGETAEIGFTIRQHGVTPVNPDGEVGLVLRSTSGEVRYFAAEPVGDVGHHVAEVTFPDDGTWSWAVRQGWFAEQPLGEIALVPPPDTVAAGSGYRWPEWIRFGLPALALLFAAGAVLDVTGDRRRRRRVLAA